MVNLFLSLSSSSSGERGLHMLCAFFGILQIRTEDYVAALELTEASEIRRKSTKNRNSELVYSKHCSISFL